MNLTLERYEDAPSEYVTGSSITYPNIASDFDNNLWVKFKKVGRLQRNSLTTDKPVTYYAGGTQKQSICEVSSPNKVCIGGYWTNSQHKTALSWIRDTIYYRGKYYRIAWLQNEFNYGILSAAVSGNKILLITGKIYQGWDTAKYEYSNNAMDDVFFDAYQITGYTETELVLNHIAAYSILTTGRNSEDEILAGFFNNPLNFWLYTRNSLNLGRELTSYHINADTFAIESSQSIYNPVDFNLDIGIDAQFKNVFSVANYDTARHCQLWQYENDLLTLITDNVPTANPIYMYFFADTNRQVYLYQDDVNLIMLSFKGVLYNVQSLPFTDITDAPALGLGNDYFCYAYNGKLLVFCYFLFTMIIDCTKPTLEYKKYDYRFDAFFQSGFGTSFAPLSIK